MSTDRKVAHNWDDGREEVSAEHTRLETERDQYKNQLDAIRALLGAPPQEFNNYLMKIVELSAKKRGRYCERRLFTGNGCPFAPIFSHQALLPRTAKSRVGTR
ncbi:hypothetical protein [Novosphingobium sp. FSW06-99]|uniref:hypothetical protein n=1 Tax=Novosphingobium sp. FSW06-99 TaxID=1739113 RepID=UPI000B1282F9|nr:hypothetical protein [Novosphingobium sp. FSW06-99]